MITDYAEELFCIQHSHYYYTDEAFGDCPICYYESKYGDKFSNDRGHDNES